MQPDHRRHIVWGQHHVPPIRRLGGTQRYRDLDHSLPLDVEGGPFPRSKRRKKATARLAAYSRKAANRRADDLHKLAADIVAIFDRIAVEDLTSQGLARSMLAKDVLDAVWGLLRALIADKAERAGKLVVAVDPRGTSQECPCCGAKVKKTLADRVHRCPDCGLVEDRDVAAASVIEFRVFGRQAGGVPGNWSEKPPRFSRRSDHAPSLHPDRRIRSPVPVGHPRPAHLFRYP
ncbi:RNA-guided endonuclease TnpB family protein [Azospirillum sp. TSH20]|uniref:RNA-guided endonuclease InsQ/TnpB family protein n=1 Tax=Azospirillum sp. TSH20 TaxID=652754 RepID=UPI001FFFC609|nr:RNA-guided endonuclease TnpB family protein [Azospirillum sp. TSH20]